MEKKKKNNNKKKIADQGIKQVQSLKALESEENKQKIKSIERIFPKEVRELMKLIMKWMKLKNGKKKSKEI